MNDPAYHLQDEALPDWHSAAEVPRGYTGPCWYRDRLWQTSAEIIRIASGGTRAGGAWRRGVVADTVVTDLEAINEGGYGLAAPLPSEQPLDCIMLDPTQSTAAEWLVSHGIVPWIIPNNPLVSRDQPAAWSAGWHAVMVRSRVGRVVLFARPHGDQWQGAVGTFLRGPAHPWGGLVEGERMHSDPSDARADAEALLTMMQGRDLLAHAIADELMQCGPRR